VRTSFSWLKKRKHAGIWYNKKKEREMVIEREAEHGTLR
jgi:hypothetical protein